VAVSRIAETEEDRIYETLREAGCRLTVSTRSVIAVLLEGNGHLTADDVIAEIENRTRGISPSTIYRVLQRLDLLGVVEHVHSGHGPTFYHLKARGHAHLVCSDCGQIIDVPGDVLTGVTRRIKRSHHFEIEPRHTALIGRCEACTTPHIP
jgi:Fur family ferric uptake transcriptional regulator